MNRVVVFCTLFCAAAATILAQSPPQGVQCVVNSGVPPTVRSEGLTELVGDIVITCTGGTPTPAGQLVPQVNFTLFLNTQSTSRVTSMLATQGGALFNEALLLIDEPNATKQVGCSRPPCQINSTGNPALTYQTPGNPNVYMARSVSVSAIEWDGVPIDPPGTNGQRIIRMTNVRANANQLSGGVGMSTILGNLSISSPGTMPLTFNSIPLATTQPGLAVGAIQTAGAEFCSNFNNGNIFVDVGGTPTGVQSILRFSEALPHAFKPPGTPQQNVPGTIYNTEGGFVPNTSAGLPSGIGFSDYGTRLRAVFNNIPNGVSVFVPVRGNIVTSSGTQAGTFVTEQAGATQMGNNLLFSPDANSSISTFFQVSTINPMIPGPLSLSFPVMFQGSPNRIPVTVEADMGFANVLGFSSALYALGSSGAPPIPSFAPPFNGVATPMYVPFQYPLTIVPCNNAGPALSTFSPNPMINFIGAIGSPSTGGTSVAMPDASASPEATAANTTLIAPRVSNIAIISPQQTASNVTVTKDASATWLNVVLSQTTTPLTAYLSVNPAAVGQYSTTLKFNAPGTAGVSVPVSYNVSVAPWFTTYGFGNLASYVNGVVSPGEPFIIFGGDAFGPTTFAGPSLGPDGRVANLIGNTQVLFDGQPVPLYYSFNNSGYGQVTGFAPFGLDGKTQTNVQVVYNGVASPPISLPVLDAVPGLITSDSSGGGQGAILNQDGSINGSTNPESPGNLVVLFGGGAGQTVPAGRDGALAGSGAALPSIKLPLKVFIDGIQATDIPYAGPPPGEVEGLFQIDVRIPAGARHNANVPVVVQFGDKQTPPGVTIATK